MNESSFSAWLIKHLRNHNAFVQRLEVTTGSGVPDLCLIAYGQTIWLELKWNTNHIRPEQKVWAHRAHSIGAIPVFYLCGYKKGHMTLYKYSGTESTQPMTKTFKLTHELKTFERKKPEIPNLMDCLHQNSPTNP